MKHPRMICFPTRTEMFPELNEGSMNGSNESGTRKKNKEKKSFVYSYIDAGFKI
jgi:hypothetical protein